MTEQPTTTTYTVTLARPSRSKCPNAWARRHDQDGWLSDTFTAEHGAILELGGTVRRATRNEQVRERVTIDEAGTWSAWAGTGSITVVAS